MPPGFTGDLLSPSFLATELASWQSAVESRQAVSLTRWWTRVSSRLGPASSPRLVLDAAVLPLLERLGYNVLRLDPSSPAGFLGTIGAGNRVLAAIVILPWGNALDAGWRSAVTTGAIAGTRWVIITNGRTLRIIEASRPWTRRALDIDLGLALNDPAGVQALMATAHAAALTPSAHDEGPLMRMVTASDLHASESCAVLGEGVLDALGILLGSLDEGARKKRIDVPPAVVFEQALTIVYRVLFLLFAEARALVPSWHRVYRESYTIDALCRRIARRAHAPGVWAALQAISRLSHAGCRAGDLRVTPFNGRLFSPSAAPLAERVVLDDSTAREALLALSTGQSRSGRRRIAFADLGVEQLGSVYESVLDYEAARDDRRLALRRTSIARKTSGSFYTPRSITDFIVRRTLHPLVSGRSSADILSLRVLDPAMGSGAFLVAACRYLADACEQANLADGRWQPADVTREARGTLRRLVAERCLYGVDRNPVAVQLARLSMWLTTLASDRPLTFLDHRLAVGNSLVGARLQDLARRPPLRGGRTARQPAALPLFDEHTASEMAAVVLPARFRLALEPGDTIAAVRRKEREMEAMTSPGAPLSRWRAAADAWCAAWCWPGGRLHGGAFAELMSALLGRAHGLPAHTLEKLAAQVSAIAAGQQFFHWELAFPEVFFTLDGLRSADGGFDAIIGNPPWEMVRSDTGTARDRALARTPTADLVTFTRDTGVYLHQGSGHPNLYRLFVERALQLLRPGGRLGLVLPSTLGTDQGSGPLRRVLLSRTRLDPIEGFHNREAIFPIHRSIRFFALTATTGGSTDVLRARYGMTDPRVLDALPDSPREDGAEAAPIHIARERLEKWDAEHVTWPEFATAKDASIFARLAERVPSLGSPAGWNAQFGRELNATEDRASFAPMPRRLGEVDARPLLPVVEGKCLAPFTSDLVTPQGITESDAARLLPSLPFTRARIAYRDVASATNRLTLIAALLPAGCVSTHTVFCLKSPPSLSAQYCLLALLNSLVANYLVRVHVTTHVTVSIVSRLPVPSPPAGSAERRELAVLARQLSRRGVERAPEAYVRLNAITAKLYGLSADEYAHVIGTFPLLDQALRDACVAGFSPACR